jgi:hypothetical protein
MRMFALTASTTPKRTFVWQQLAIPSTCLSNVSATGVRALSEWPPARCIQADSHRRTDHHPSHRLGRYVFSRSSFRRPLNQASAPTPTVDPREALSVHPWRAPIGACHSVGVRQNVFPIDLVVKQVETVVRLLLRFPVASAEVPVSQSVLPGSSSMSGATNCGLPGIWPGELCHSHGKRICQEGVVPLTAR